MKVTLGEDGFDERLYDRDNSQGAAQAALNECQAKKTFYSGV